MKRIIGHLVVVGVVSSGIALAAAGPSSALPDDPCMDAANYLTQAAWYQTHTDSAFDRLVEWSNPDHYINPLSGQETWTAALASGAVSVYSLSDLTQRQSSALYDYEHNQLAQMDWEGSHYPC